MEAAVGGLTQVHAPIWRAWGAPIPKLCSLGRPSRQNWNDTEKISMAPAQGWHHEYQSFVGLSGDPYSMQQGCKKRRLV